MALSLEALYGPFNDFFLQKFVTSEGAGVKFRFARLPRAFVDSDFVTPLHPEFGPLQALADEQFSTAVDGIPRLDEDSRTVWLSTFRLSDLYHDEIVGPSLPFVPDDVTDAAQKQVCIDGFNVAKSEALALWASIKSESIWAGAGVEFRPSMAAPRKWWDKTDTQVWSSQAFQVKGAATDALQPAKPPDKLLRMKVSDEVLQQVLQSHITPGLKVAPAPPPAPSPFAAPAHELSAHAVMMAKPVFHAALVANQGHTVAAAASPAFAAHAVVADGASNAASTALHSDVSARMVALPFRERMEVQAMLAAHQPFQSVATSDVTISFDYCIVSVTRPWLHNAFINNSFWCIPGQGRGKLSANDGHGLPALPVGFVAVKKLRIAANWTSEDISNLQQSVQFGPFGFDSAVVGGAIAHEGIQVVGWVLQGIPDLPPNASE